jgi:hypothetical protein
MFPSGCCQRINGKAMSKQKKPPKLYIQDNEHPRKIKIVTVKHKGDNEGDEKLGQDIEFLDREYSEIEIEFLSIQGKFGPELIRQLSQQWNVPVNFMFIGSPGDHFPCRVAELGGVRLII